MNTTLTKLSPSFGTGIVNHSAGYKVNIRCSSTARRCRCQRPGVLDCKSQKRGLLAVPQSPWAPDIWEVCKLHDNSSPTSTATTYQQPTPTSAYSAMVSMMPSQNAKLTSKEMPHAPEGREGGTGLGEWAKRASTCCSCPTCSTA